MKKIILAIALLFAVGSNVVFAQQPVRVKYYYYPSSNVYYNPVTNEYWYYDGGTTTWMEVKTLPSGITITKMPKYTVYYNGADVWKDNATHKKKYKVKNGAVVTKTKPKKTY